MTGTNISCTSRRARPAARRGRSLWSSLPTGKRPVRSSAGGRTSRCSRISTFRRSTSRAWFAGRPSSTRASLSGRIQKNGKFETRDFLYENGIKDYVAELAGENPLTQPEFISAERKGRDREDKPEYKVKLSAAFCFSNRVTALEYYHNSSWLENGGAPDKAVRTAFTYAIDAYIKKQGKYQKNESAIKFQDVQDCLVLVTNCFSTQTSYENQTKKAINNKFIQTAMTEFFKERLEIYFIENKPEAGPRGRAGADKQAQPRARRKRARKRHEEDSCNPATLDIA